MQNYPTIRQLQYLNALSKTNNYRRAAEKCFVTQPTLSSAIQELEKTLDADVIDRSRAKQIKLTPLGLSLVKSSKNIFNELDSVLQDALETQKPLSGAFRLGLIPTIAPYLLPQILPKLQNKFPDMSFEITEDMSANLVAQLDKGELDLAIMAFPYDTPNLQQEILIEEPFYCAAPIKFFKQKTISMNDLDDKKILLLQDGHCLRDHALAACKLQRREEISSLSATSLITLIQMVGQGYGVTLLPKMVTDAGPLPNNVKIYKFKSPVPMRKIGLAWRNGTALDKNINAVREYLKTTIK